MNIPEIRDKILAFLLPIVIIGLVLGGGIVFLAKAYFWDVSRLTLILPAGETSSVTVAVQARIVYFDADILGFYYPVHLTLPVSRELTCAGSCVIDRLPPGDAVITVYHPQGTSERLRALIVPDTAGTIDLRPAFQIIPVADEQIRASLQAPSLSSEEEKTLTGMERTYPVHGLVLLRRDHDRYLYDTRSKQILPLPVPLPLHMALGRKAGEYLFWTGNGVVSWDRYGQRPMQILEELVHGGYTFTWQGDTTTLTQPAGRQTLEGLWSPIFAADTFAITDGEDVMQVR